MIHWWTGVLLFLFGAWIGYYFAAMLVANDESREDDDDDW